MVILGRTDDSGGTGGREYYTVLLKDGVMDDVMAVYDMGDGKKLDTVYVMELEDGGTAYTYGSDGGSVGIVSDYGVSEEEIVSFVLCHMDTFTEQYRSQVLLKKMMDTDEGRWHEERKGQVQWAVWMEQ